MFFKKVNILLFIITLINCVILFKNIGISHNYSQFCLLSDSKSFQSYSVNNKNYLAHLKAELKKQVIDLEQQREDLLNEILIKTTQLNKINNDNYHLSLKSFRIKHSIISLQQIRKDYERRHQNEDNVKPVISRFKSATSDVNYTIYGDYMRTFVAIDRCSIHTCVDLNRCQSLTLSLDTNSPNESAMWASAVRRSSHYSNQTSCITMVLSYSSVPQLDHCHTHNCAYLVLNESLVLHSQRSMVARSYFTNAMYRPRYDIVTSSLIGDSPPLSLSLLFPSRRRYLLSFTTSVDVKLLPRLDSFVINYLLNVSDEIQMETGDNKMYIDVNCLPSVNTPKERLKWGLCQGTEARIMRLNKSKFCLILSPIDVDVLSTDVDQRRLLECLFAASIPVVLGDFLLPFDELVDWSRAVVKLPKQRVTDVVRVIENIPDSECFQMKSFGKSILETYLLQPSLQMNAISNILSKRMGIELPQSPSYPTKLYYDTVPNRYYNFSLPNFQIEIDPYLGPSDVPVTKSSSFMNNFVQSSVARHEMDLKSASYLYPSTPWDPQLSADSSLRGHLARGYLAINHTVNEAGTEFMHSLGGNFIYEQFTIIILSYKRHSLLLKSLELLNDLPYLHSVIVIWNDPEPPSPNFIWPKLHVEIKVVKTPGNSLNNRFLPYDVIGTDAILSFDDDMQLRHDEIIFAFRVWRENRDRIVGFISRYHSEYPGPAKGRYTNNQWWMYNANYTCEYSMILTGAAFFHRFYLYSYSNDMNIKIRQIVNKYNNCEDIAMNFLVSHITRKPPIKVTVRWTLACINCDSKYNNNNNEALHNRADHYAVRSSCINEFAIVFGYNPLLYSQYRADSVLFKTRLPTDKQKCYRYI